MKTTAILFAIGLLIFAAVGPAVSEDPAKKVSATSLRQPGFLFLELTVENVADHVAFFGAVADYKPLEQDGKWAWLQSTRGDLMFNGTGGVPGRGQPAGKRRVGGVEIGIVVADLDKCLAAVTKFADKGFRLAEGIARRPWGPRDFRVFTPDGYYLRFTEPM